MPPFELVIPESFLFIPANLSYISFSFFISFIFFRIFKSIIVFILILLGFLSLMYSDLIFKYAIKSYYEIIKAERTIYFYPVKNEDGKIDSLSTSRIYNFPLSKSSLSQYEENKIIKLHELYISKFIDISTVSYRYNKYFYNDKRIFLNIYKYDNSFVEDLNKKAKYTIRKKQKESLYPNLYSEFEYSFIDTWTNNILATAYIIHFPIRTNKLRNRFLYWTKEKEADFNLDSIQNFDTIYKKLFID